MTSFRLLSLLVVLGLSACSSAEQPASSPDEPPLPVRVNHVVRTETVPVIRYPGTVVSEHTVRLSTRIMGRIAHLPFEEGAPVHRGEVLVRLRDEDVQAQLTQARAGLREAEATLASAEATYRRITNLYEAESATRKEYEDALAQYERAQAAVEAMRARLAEARETLGYTVLTAPFDGVVTHKFADAGDLAVPGQPLLALEDPHRLKIVAQVPEKEVERTAVGDTVTLEVTALGSSPVAGVVARINPSGRPGSRQFDIHVRLLDVPAGLKPGMFARVILQAEATPVITLPVSALVRRGQLTGVFTVSPEGRAFLRWIRTGKQLGDRVEVLSGLTEGEAYVVGAEGRLHDGRLVRLLN